MNKLRYPIGDPLPKWMLSKPTTAMKMEWENATARWFMDNKLVPRAAKNVSVTPANILMYLRQEHPRWHDIEITQMTTHFEAINSLNTHMSRFKTKIEDLKRLMEDNRDRTDLIELPATPKTFGKQEIRPVSETVSVKDDESDVKQPQLLDNITPAGAPQQVEESHPLTQEMPRISLLGKRDEPESPREAAQSIWVQLGQAVYALKRAKR